MVAFGVVRRHALVDQGYQTAVTFRPDCDGDDSHSRIELGHAEGKDEPTRPIDLQIFANMADIAHVWAPLGKREAAPDTRIDLCRDHFARNGGKQKVTRGLYFQEGVEH